jgi:hypothetical protein
LRRKSVAAAAVANPTWRKLAEKIHLKQPKRWTPRARMPKNLRDAGRNKPLLKSSLRQSAHTPKNSRDAIHKFARSVNRTFEKARTQPT